MHTQDNAQHSRILFDGHFDYGLIVIKYLLSNVANNKKKLLMLACRSARIALLKNTSLPDCFCNNDNATACAECWSYFSWRDATPMTWSNWDPTRNTSSYCGFMTEDGLWHSGGCDSLEPFLCQRCKSRAAV